MLQGSLVALITPFLENRQLDIDCFKRLIHFQIEAGTEGLVIAGTAGEAPTLSKEETDLLIQVAVQEARGRVPIIAGASSNSTQVAVQNICRAKELGADAVLVTFPYYNKPTFMGCFEHFKEVLKCQLPTIVYYNPGRTGVFLSVKQLAEICDIPGVIALKESSGDVDYCLEFMRCSSTPVLSGNDTLTLPLIAVGALGCISVVANIFPRKWKEIVQGAVQGNIAHSRAAYQKLAAFCNAVFLETNPQGIKYAMSLRDLCSPIWRLPLLSPQKEVCQKIKEEFLKVSLVNDLQPVAHLL